MQTQTIAMIGLGGGGARILRDVPPDDRFKRLIIDSDSRVPEHEGLTSVALQTERPATGLGGDTSRAAALLRNHKDNILPFLDGADLIILLASLGGGTGSGALPELVQLVQPRGAPVLAFLTLPFEFEGGSRRKAAQHTLAQVVDHGVLTLGIPNERLFAVAGRTRFTECFDQADHILGMGVGAIGKLLARPGYLNLSLADLESMVAHAGGETGFAVGIGRGETRAREAVLSLLNGPMLESGRMLERARHVLVSIAADDSLTLKELGDVMSILRGRMHPDAHVRVGTAIDEVFADQLVVTVVTAEKDSERSTTKATTVAKDDIKKTETPPPTANRSRSRRKKTLEEPELQTRMTFEPQGKGRFRGVNPTMIGGEDLDIPTFIRRGIAIER